MKCWWPDIKYIGCGDYVPGMVEGSDGDYVLVDDHLAEVRQAQRRMIAALYWRAGIYACGSVVAGENGYIERCRALAERAYALRCTADAMEFPL